MMDTTLTDTEVVKRLGMKVRLTSENVVGDMIKPLEKLEEYQGIERERTLAADLNDDEKLKRVMEMYPDKSEEQLRMFMKTLWADKQS